MCYLIVTLRSLLWTVISIGVVVMHVFAIINPDWLLRQEKPFVSFPYTATTPRHMSTANVLGTGRPATSVSVISQSSALGFLKRCTNSMPGGVLYRVDDGTPAQECVWITSFSEIPTWLWKVTVIFYCLGVAILGLIAVVSVFSLCFRSICRKSLFTVCGLVQAIAGLIILLGLVMYPAGWGSGAVTELCGTDAAPFQFGACTLGWSFYVAAGATVLTFACAVLSVQAEIATASDDVQDEILKGKYVICLP